MHAQRSEPIAGDVRVRVLLVLPNRVHGDLDNLAKAILDAANGLAYADDKSIAHLTVWREYDASSPRAELWVEAMMANAEDAKCTAICAEAKAKAKLAARRATPEYKAKRAAAAAKHAATPEGKAKMAAYQATPEYKARRAAKQAARQATPEGKAYQAAYRAKQARGKKSTK